MKYLNKMFKQLRYTLKIMIKFKTMLATLKVKKRQKTLEQLTKFRPQKERVMCNIVYKSFSRCLDLEDSSTISKKSHSL